MNNLVWFRRDLRVEDNPALYHACSDAESSGGGVVAVYCITHQQWKEHEDADRKIQFWIENVRELAARLNTLNIPLRIVDCKTFDNVPMELLKLCDEFKCASLFLNREYEVNEERRDDEVAAAFEDRQMSVHRFHDRVIVPPKEITTGEGKFYSVFTPYRKRWDQRAREFLTLLPVPPKQKKIDVKSSEVPSKVTSFKFTDDALEDFPAGEANAKRRLTAFSKKMSDYDDARDIPSIDGTSQLSAYLVAGAISARMCAQEALKNKTGDIKGKNDGARVWLSELTWRDFYSQVLVACPRVSMHQPFKEKTKGVAWRDSEADFTAWCEGRTGYPIVDAGMRQLNQTGWMHNRLRMVTAMFLTKNLLIDWRKGERYFMQKLIDGDLAANNGGWQWSASTGTDSVPYFRIFSPFSQSKRFDPDGTFIKQMCPELANLPASALHDEKKLTKAIDERGADYPKYVTDYKESRKRAIEAFKSLNED